MKIVHIITDLDTGGAEMSLYKLLASIDRNIFNVAVVSLIDEGTIGKQIKKLNISVYSIGMKRGVPTPLGIWKLIKIIRKLQPDLIQGWMYHGNVASFLVAKMSGGRPRVCWNIRHSVYDIAYEKQLTRMLIKLGTFLSNRVDTVIYNSSVSRGQHEKLGYDTARSVVVPNGFDTAIFRPDENARHSVRRELGVADSVALVGLIGRYHPMKDHENFLRAAKIILSHDKDVRFLLAGKDVDSTNKVLLDQVKMNGLQNSIFLLGERSDIARLTAALDISSSSSYGEAFPNVIGEAMACGVPCVVTDVGDSAWVVGGTGRVVPPRNPQALADKVIQLLDLSEYERNALGKRVRRRIEEHFTLDKIVRHYEILYTK